MACLRSTHFSKALGRQLCNRTLATSTRRLAEEVRIVEVGPRDGLQNEKNTIPLKTKIELIQRLAKTGVRDIEAGSFVAPKWVPQVRPITLRMSPSSIGLSTTVMLATDIFMS